MYTWGPFPFIRYALALIVGILLQQEAQPGLDHATYLVGIFSIATVFWMLHLFADNQLLRFLSGSSILVAVSIIGIFLADFSDDSLKPGHYSAFEGVDAFKGVVVSDNSERRDYHRYDFQVESVRTDSATLPAFGKLYLYVKKKGDDRIYEYGDELTVYDGYFPVSGPGNPNEFDYRAYLLKQNIHGHAFADAEDVLWEGNYPPNLVMKTAYAIRSVSKKIIFESITKPREQAILSALLIGVKDHLDDSTKKAYAQAGAMHVLAVSGLHVGIVYILINFVFGFIKKMKFGQIMFISLALILIWFYALVTGFSPSVLRASVMFSVILISQTMSKSANIYNSLGIAAFVLLLYDPFLIYSVGFQLSFAAVFGIVFLQPKLYRLWLAPNKLIDYLWAITCVSIAAQLATFPLTVYYFHQFPTYFLVSNVVVIPTAMGMLLAGIVMVFGFLIHPFLGKFIGFVLTWFMWVVNELISMLSLLPLPIVDWLYFDFADTFMVYGIILLIALAFNYQNRTSLFMGLCLSLLLFSWINWKFHEQAHQKSIIFYEIKDHIAIDLVHGQSATLLIDKMGFQEQEVIGFQVNPFRLAHGLPPIEETYEEMGESEMVVESQFGHVIHWQDKSILILKADVDWRLVQDLEADYIYVDDHDFGSVEKLKAEKVILGSGIRYYHYGWLEEKLTTQNLPVHNLKRDGFYQINL